ncbi:MAG: hypothetical protein V3R57_00265 [Candidatus Bathyarchaeia archaeon]
MGIIDYLAKKRAKSQSERRIEARAKRLFSLPRNGRPTSLERTVQRFNDLFPRGKLAI